MVSATASDQFENDVADEPVADDDVGLAAHHIAALDIPDEIERGLGQELERFLGKLVALGLLFADGKEADLGFGFFKEILCGILRP